AGTVQGQGHPLRGRASAAQGRQVLHQRRLMREATMDHQKEKRKRQLRRKRHVRRRIVGTIERPRLTVFRSSKHIYAQLIDDLRGVTLAAVSSLIGDVKGALPQSKTQQPYGANVPPPPPLAHPPP